MDHAWAQRLAAGREAVYVICDADEVGRRKARDVAGAIAKCGTDAFVVNLTPERDDGYDVGDLLVEFGRVGAQRIIDYFAFNAGPPVVVPEPEPSRSPARFTTRALDLDAMRPTRFGWRDRLVRGAINVPVGAEGVGKGTLLMWIIAKLTRGELPGDLEGTPARVLWLGQEDSWEEVVSPRAFAAGADTALVAEMVATNHREVFNVQRDDAELEHIIRAGPFAAVVFEALLDNMPRTNNGFDPQYVRQALHPLRRALRATGAIGLTTLHTNKSRARTLRERMGSSVQYNALSRSTLYLDDHPNDPDRRVVLGAKQNLSRRATTVGFTIREHVFERNGHTFGVSVRPTCAKSPTSRRIPCSTRARATAGATLAVTACSWPSPTSRRASVRWPRRPACRRPRCAAFSMTWPTTNARARAAPDGWSTGPVPI